MLVSLGFRGPRGEVRGSRVVRTGINAQMERLTKMDFKLS